MKVIIKPAQSVEIATSADIERVLLAGRDIEVLNFGQGEGQFRIGDSVWGIYYGGRRRDCVVLQYEEGLVPWSDFLGSLQVLFDLMRAEWGPDLEFAVEGCLESSLEPHERYLT